MSRSERARRWARPGSHGLVVRDTAPTIGHLRPAAKPIERRPGETSSAFGPDFGSACRVTLSLRAAPACRLIFFVTGMQQGADAWSWDRTDDGIGSMLLQPSYVEIVTIALKEIKTGSDRVAGIVTPAFLDDLPGIVLRNHLHQNDELLNDMLKPGGKLGEFGIKIDMALLLGIISDRARKDLHRIRRIRNEFAHNAGLDSFNKSQ